MDLVVLDGAKLCFRAYDIRGPAASGYLTPELAYAIGLAIGREAQCRDIHSIIVARDGRLSGPALCDALIRGLRAQGIGVIFIGIVPTPVLYFATHTLIIDSTLISSGVMVTASHNPGDHNGFKIILGGKALTSDALQDLYQHICQQSESEVAASTTPGMGAYEVYEGILDSYIDYIVHKITLARPLKVVLDCGNGVAAVVAPALFRCLGCQVIELFCELDGHFPHHHPDPTVPENLTHLIAKVQAVQADIGFAFDGDGDRLGVVTNRGEIIWPDRQMMLFAIDVLKHHPGAPIIFDVKCSRHLPEVIAAHGGKPVMWRTGHSLIKAHALAIDAPLAGELSGHIFFRDEWFGFDDGMYVGARLLEIIAERPATVSDIFHALPNSINTPELKIAVDNEAQKSEYIDRLISEGDFFGAHLVTLDGLRIEYPDGWALIRASNTSPYLTLRFEADTLVALERIQGMIRSQLLSILDIHF